MPVKVWPRSSPSGGSKDLRVPTPLARADSTTPPASAAPRRRTMISTSGSSGTARRHRSLRRGGGRLPAPEAAAKRAQRRHVDGDAVAVGDGERRERGHALAGDDDAG